MKFFLPNAATNTGFFFAEGRPNPDRNWTECFAQLVGTVLSLWDAAELDTAGEDGEVLPKFINLTDASIKVVSFHSLKTSYPERETATIATAVKITREG